MRDMGIPENLKRLRKREKLSQTELAKKASVSQQLISQLERGENLTTKMLPQIARALNASIYEVDENYASDDEPMVFAVPVLSMVSAGLLDRDDVSDEALATLRVSDLPPGDWIALKVQGDSMDRISPPESVILVNRADRRLVPNALYVIADEEGNATYKRYRPGPPARFEPVSTNTNLEPIFPQHEPTIIGRVRRTILDT